MLFFNPFSSSQKKEEVVQSSTPEKQSASVEVAPLIYPPEMRADVTRPCMQFVAHERKLSGVVHRHPIWFPAPANIAFDDGADFGQEDLGMLGEAVGLASGNSSIGDMAGRIASTNAKQLLNIGMKVLPDSLQSGGTLVTQSIMNPNTNTTFNKNTVRQFGFTFKMVARSEAESNLIRKIQTKFRHFLYASRGGESNTQTLEYPPVWTVKFMNMDSGTENPYIPRIYSTYCTSVNTNFNATGNIYYTDNAPLEVDIELTFQETRSLNRSDIEMMENDKLGNRGIDESGMPLVITDIPQPEPAPTKGK